MLCKMRKFKSKISTVGQVDSTSQKFAVKLRFHEKNKYGYVD